MTIKATIKPTQKLEEMLNPKKRRQIHAWVDEDVFTKTKNCLKKHDLQWTEALNQALLLLIEVVENYSHQKRK